MIPTAPPGMTGPDSTSAAAPLRDVAVPATSWLAALHERVLALEGQSVDLQPVLEVMANALAKAGFAPERLSVSVLTQHPGLSGLAYIWSRVQARVVFLERPPGFLDSAEHLASPLHHVLTTRSPLFIDQQALPEDPRFPIVREFAQFGATSYLALPLFAARGMSMCWRSSRPVRAVGALPMRPSSAGWCRCSRC